MVGKVLELRFENEWIIWSPENTIFAENFKTSVRNILKELVSGKSYATWTDGIISKMKEKKKDFFINQLNVHLQKREKKIV